MGMFDWYEPDPGLSCPHCRAALSDWQGKDGPNLLFHWKQSVWGPIAQDEACQFWTKPLPKKQRVLFRLPPTFELHTSCPNGHRAEAIGYAANGLWHHTEFRSTRVFEQTTYDRLTGISNDYSAEEELFQQGLIGLVDVQWFDRNTSEPRSRERKSVYDHFLKGSPRTLSIVMPVRGRRWAFLESVKSIYRQDFVIAHADAVELIIVQDGPSDDPSSEPLGDELFRLIEADSAAPSVRFFQTNRSYGRSTARNIGLFHVKNEIVMFVDASMVLAPDCLTDQMLRHDRLDRIALLGFKENISRDEYLRSHSEIETGIRRPDSKRDWKYSHTLGPGMDTFTFRGKTFHQGDTIHYMGATNDLRSLPATEAIGYRTLPTFLQTNLVSVGSAAAKGIGGFETNFDPLWGMEDSYFGALLVARGIKLVPCPSSVAFKIEHEEDPEKDFDLFRNRQLFDERLRKVVPNTRGERRLAELLDNLHRNAAVREIIRPPS